MCRQRATQYVAKTTVLNPATTHGVSLLLQIGKQRVEQLIVEPQGVCRGIEFLEQSPRSRAVRVVQVLEQLAGLPLLYGLLRSSRRYPRPRRSAARLGEGELAFEFGPALAVAQNKIATRIERIRRAQTRKRAFRFAVHPSQPRAIGAQAEEHF